MEAFYSATCSEKQTSTLCAGTGIVLNPNKSCISTAKRSKLLGIILIEHLILSELGNVGLEGKVIHPVAEVVLGAGQLGQGEVSERIGEDGDERESEIGADSAETLSEIHCLESRICQSVEVFNS